MSVTSAVPVESVRGLDLEASLARLRRACAREPSPPLKERLRHLSRLEEMVLDRREAIAESISADFGHRSHHESTIAEVFMTVEGARHARAHLAEWMKSERRKVGLAFLPASTRVHYQPKGVVGVIAPWNYPVVLSLAPMVGALAAGNRVMLKPSELTPRTSALLAQMLGEAFPSDLVHTVTGDAEVGAAFSRLPFDHLVFTGSTRVGKLVMKAAAENLVPVTLELGGKSPTIVHESYPVEKAAEALVLGKLFNAGQTCIAPDYVLVQEGRVDALVRAVEERVRRSYAGGLLHNPDYSAIVSPRHKARLLGVLSDAVSKGARAIPLDPAGESFEGSGKLCPTLLLDVHDDMLVMQEEIFGPLLPIVPYRGLEDAMRYVNERPRPLALYYFDDDPKRARVVLKGTTSGGAAVNACMLHFGQDDAPFGGIGPSGMGAYHGVEGFRTFSHAKTVFYQSKVNATALLAPPYGALIETAMRMLLRR